jgi:hypothetical protein
MKILKLKCIKFKRFCVDILSTYYIKWRKLINLNLIRFVVESAIKFEDIKSKETYWIKN